jgi:O-antigen ligase
VGGQRVGGTIGSVNTAGSYLAPTLAITFGGYLTQGKLANRPLSLAAFGLGTIALVFTLSRNSWFSFAVAMAIIIWRAIKTEKERQAVTLVLALGLLVGALFSGQIVNRLTKDDRGSVESRQRLAEMAQNIIQAHPLGVGINNYDEVKSDKYAPPELVGHRLYIVHNKYLLVWAETGLLGLLTLMGLLLTAIVRGFRWLSKPNAPPHLSILLTSVVAALCGYAYHMFNDSFASRIHDQHIWFMVALIAATSQLIIEALSKEELDFDVQATDLPQNAPG